MSPVRGAVLLGAALALAGWALASGPLGIAGVGLLVAAAWGAAWAAVASRAVAVERTVPRASLVEGDDLRYEVRLRGARLLPGTFRLHEQLGPAGTLELRLARRSAVVGGVAAAPRGRYEVGPARLVGIEPLMLGRVERVVPADGAVVVVPRVPLVEVAFHDGGRRAGDGRRPFARRAGAEPLGVRDYEDGEPLRAIHWASSARRGRLMARELHDLPDDDAVVLLDLDARGLAGVPGRSSIDEAVRAAAGLARAAAARGRRSALVLAGREPRRLPVTSLGRDWEDLLTALAAVEPEPDACAGALLRSGGRLLGRGTLTLVTALPVDDVTDALEARGGGSVVLVDAPTYAGSSPSPPTAGLLRLAARGIPVAVVRSGDDLGAALSARARAVAHG